MLFPCNRLLVLSLFSALAFACSRGARSSGATSGGESVALSHAAPKEASSQKGDAPTETGAPRGAADASAAPDWSHPLRLPVKLLVSPTQEPAAWVPSVRLSSALHASPDHGGTGVWLHGGEGIFYVETSGVMRRVFSLEEIARKVPAPPPGVETPELTRRGNFIGVVSTRETLLVRTKNWLGLFERSTLRLLRSFWGLGLDYEVTADSDGFAFTVLRVRDSSLLSSDHLGTADDLELLSQSRVQLIRTDARGQLLWRKDLTIHSGGVTILPQIAAGQGVVDVLLRLQAGSKVQYFDQPRLRRTTRCTPPPPRRMDSGYQREGFMSVARFSAVDGKRIAGLAPTSEWLGLYNWRLGRDSVAEDEIPRGPVSFGSFRGDFWLRKHRVKADLPAVWSTAGQLCPWSGFLQSVFVTLKPDLRVDRIITAQGGARGLFRISDGRLLLHRTEILKESSSRAAEPSEADVLEVRRADGTVQQKIFVAARRSERPVPLVEQAPQWGEHGPDMRLVLRPLLLLSDNIILIPDLAIGPHGPLLFRLPPD